MNKKANVVTELKTEEFANFDRMFAPQSVAIIGVSEEGFGFGRGILLSLLSIGFAGKIYPVNKNGGFIKGMTIYTSVDDIPDKIDFAIIAVPAKMVPSVIDACQKKGAVGAEILSSGFSETGTKEGIALENELKTVAGKGIRLIGPNCFGIYCPKSGLTMLPGPDLSREPGGVALLSQSGGLSVDFGHIGKWRGIRFSKVVSFGNGCDLREFEMLRYLRYDTETKVICMYVEGVYDGRAFLSALKEAAGSKPVIVIKGGLSESGSRAAASHTASLGGKRAVWESALRQSHVTQVENLEELSDAALAFSLLPGKEYKGCSIVGGGGALGIAAADSAESFGLTVPRLREDLQAAILNVLPKPGSSATNPIDVANPFVRPEHIKEILLHAAKDEQIDLHIVIMLLYHYKSLKHIMGVGSIRQVTPYKELVKACSEAVQTGGKPVVIIMPNFKQEEDSMEIEEIIRETRRLFNDAGIPVYDDVKNALRAISSVSRYYSREVAKDLLNSHSNPDKYQNKEKQVEARKFIEEGIRRGDRGLNEFESKQLLHAYSIPVTREYLATSLKEALDYAHEINFPVALKGSSKTFTHKTEHNLIELGIESDDSLKGAYNALEERGEGQLDGILVQQMIKGNRELVAGMFRDPQFGPCVMFGLGGVYTEVLRDVVFRVAPLLISDALEMIDEIKGKKMLDKFRGKPAVNRDVLASVLVSLGRIGLEIPEIDEIDINPMIIHNEIPVAVDALVVLNNKKGM